MNGNGTACSEPAPTKFDFNISYACPSDCLFCNVYEKISRLGEKAKLSWPTIRTTLVERRRQGYSYVVITGGEPTVHPHFLPTLQLARYLGYRVSLNTTGHWLAREDVAHKALPLLDEVVVAFHGPTAEVHDRVIVEKGAFERLHQALRFIHEYPMRPGFMLLTNTVLTRENMDYIGEILDLAATYSKVSQFVVSNVNMPPERMNYFDQVAPRLSELRTLLPSIVAKAESHNRPIQFYGFPLCVLGEYAAYSSDILYESKLIIERKPVHDGEAEHQVGRYDAPPARVQVEICSRCDLRPHCAGVFFTYHERMGEVELTPHRGPVPPALARKLNELNERGFKGTTFGKTSGYGVDNPAGSVAA